MHYIHSTNYANDAKGWSELARDSHDMPAYALCTICRWNDRNGNWDYEDMISPNGEGMTIADVHAVCREQIIAWAEEL